MLGDNFMWFPEARNSRAPRVVGESTDAYFSKRKAFEVLSFKFAMDNKEAVDKPGGKPRSNAAKGRVKFQEFEIEKRVDSASVALYKACSEGEPFPTVMLAARRAQGSGLIYLQFIFRYVHVTGVTWSGGSGEDVTKEKMTFNFAAMGVQYVPIRADGKPQTATGALMSWSWNTITQDGKAGIASLEIQDVDPAPEFLPAQP